MNNHHSFAQRAGLMARLIPALLLACFAPVLAPAMAAPLDPQVIAGQATFSQQGNVFSITNAPGTIINWQSFSVGAGDITRFIQQSSDSAVLNRIVGQDPTRILGALQSNGHVFLINPNGVMFGRDARVDVNSLTASTLNLSNADFLAGRRNFTAGPAAGKIDNQGAITTPAGGKVFLLAPDVSNSGIITSPQGEIVLAAGRSVQLVDSANPDLRVVVAAPAGEALNLGSVVAQGGRIGIYGALVRQRGQVNANSAVVGENGRIVFKASGDTVLGAGSVTSATGAGRGGDISVQGARVGLTGDARIDASGALGGGAVQVGGSYQGRDSLVRNADQTLMGPRATIRADALASGKGGSVVLWSNGQTRAFGQISARGAGQGGGLVETSGRGLDIAGLSVDAGAGGTWLLDPYDIVIGKNGSTIALSGVDDFTDGALTGPTNLDTAMINSAAPGTGIVIQATNTITVESAITRPTGTTGGLTLEAGNNIAIDAPINTSGGALTLIANTPSHASGSGNVVVDANITTGGGKLTATGHGIVFGGRAGAVVDTGIGAIDLRALTSLQLSGNSQLNSAGNVTLVADQIFLGGLIGPSGLTRPAVQIYPVTNDRNIEVTNATSSGALVLAPSQLRAIQARQLTIGGANYPGNITVNAQLGDVSQPLEATVLSLDTGGMVAIDAPITLRSDTSSVLQVASRSFGLNGIAVGAAAPLAADTISLVSNSITIGATLTATGAESTVRLMPATGDTAIVLGENAVDGTGQLGLDGTELSGVLARKLIIGGQTGQIANTVVSGALNLTQLAPASSFQIDAGLADLSLLNRVTTPGALVLSGARISNSSAAPAKAASIKLASTVQIGDAGNSLPFVTETGFLTASNVNTSGTQPIDISNTGPLSLGSVVQSGSANNGAIRIVNQGALTVLKNEPASTAPVLIGTNGGAISLTALSPLTIDGSVNSNGGAVALTAGNGGVLTIGPTGTVASGAGNMSLTGGSIVHQGSVSSTSGSITFTGSPVTGNGTVATVSGTVTNAPLTLAQCTANPSLPGCGAVLPSLTQCTAAPSTPGCSVVLPSLAQCLATPSLAGCSAVLPTATECAATPTLPGCATVLPTLAQCTAAPATPGCSAVLPSLAQCVSAPATPGCSVVLPSLSQCIASPSTPGCDAVMPSLSQCTVSPGMPGCEVILPSLSQCTASPSTPGCSAVLPSLSQCTTSPATPGCSAVLPTLSQCTATPATPGCAAVLPTLSQCTATPATPGCSAVLPTLSQCTAAPTTPGCAAVLPSLAQCSANPALAGCSAVLPTLAQCTAAPTTAGCAAVLPTLAACTAAPATPGCAAVLPTLTQCTAAPATIGCSAVLPSLQACIANPAAAGCTAVLPSLNRCIANPATPGCGVVLPSLASCVANPAGAGCSVVLPSLASCTNNPATPGCSVVLPSLAQCVASPTSAGCSVVLPTLTACIGNPAATGCSVVLPSLPSCVAAPTTAGCAVVLPSLATCIATPGASGCGVVLPSLAQCTVNPSLGGCAVVLPTLAQCSAAPALAGCTAVLPSLARCIANPALAGCAVVLPGLSQCVATPTLGGCAAVLPTLAQCTGSPTLQGCSVVLPPVSACVANPAAPGCAVVVPPQQSEPNSPAAQTGNAVVALINTTSGNVTTTAGNSVSTLDAKADTKKDDSATAAPVGNPLGEAKDVRKKTYCN